MKKNSFACSFNPIQDSRRQKAQPSPTTRFCLVTSTNVPISTQNFPSFNFDLFATLLLNFNAIPCVSPTWLNLKQDHPSKKRFFWSQPYKTKIMSSVIEMLDLPIFDHMTTFAISSIVFEVIRTRYQDIKIFYTTIKHKNISTCLKSILTHTS